MRDQMTKKTIRPLKIAVILFITLLLLSAFGVWWYLAPGREKVEPYPETEDPRIIWENEDLGTGMAFTEEETVYISKDFIQTYFDPYIHFDEPSNHITITTHDKMIQMKTEQLTAKVNEREVELNFPPLLVNDEPFLPGDLMSELYPVKINYNSADDLVILDDMERQILKGHSSKEDAIVREDSSIRSGIIQQLPKGTSFNIYKQVENWYRIRTDKGYLGYIHVDDTQLGEIDFRHVAEREHPDPPEIPIGEPINLTWEHVINETPEPEEMPELPGVNVISPTWFHLADQDGNVINLADKAYVEWAHRNNKQVWALFSNQFDPDLTHEFLRNPKARKNAIYEILLHAEIYDLDGINLDFENIHLKDKDYYTQFVRELTPFLREQGLVISVDVTFLSSSENWSMCYDRKALADTVDFVMVMAYDEHWGAGSDSGSVSSLPWVRSNLEEILNIVPNDQLVLGIPFYTRLWEEEKDGERGDPIDSSAYGMEQIERILEEHDAEITFDPKSEQYYGEYRVGDSIFRTWLETEESIKKRIELVHEHDLAGIASWRRGFEKPEIWDTIQDELKISQ